MASSSSSGNVTSSRPSFSVIIDKELSKLINTVKEISLVTSYAEVMEGLRIYILTRKLYDPMIPVKIRCNDDPLGKLFGVKEFTIYEVRGLLSKLLVPLRVQNISAGTTPSTSSTNENSVKRKAEESTNVGIKKNCDEGSNVPKDPMFLFIPPTPDRNVVESDTAESIQGYETAFVRDTGDSEESVSFSDDSDTNLQPGDILAVTETFDVEYEIESDSDPEEKMHVSDSGSDSEDAIDTVITFVCKSDSDVEFWADKSSDEEFGTDLEILDSDKWKCKRCGSFNNPPMRYCSKCWCMRTGWVAPKREEKRTSVKRKQRTRHNKLNKFPNFESTSSYKHDKSSSNSSSESPNILSSTSKIVEEMSSASLENTSDLLSNKIGKSVYDLSIESHYENSQDFSDKDYNFTKNSQMVFSSSFSSIDKKYSMLYDTGSSSQDLSTLSSYSSSQEFPSTSSYSSSQEYSSSSFYLQETSNQKSNIDYFSRTPNLSTVPKLESDSKLCLLCCSRPANASIIHGKYAHQISCYKCAKKLHNENKRCPVCRRTIERVVHQVCVI